MTNSATPPFGPCSSVIWIGVEHESARANNAQLNSPDFLSIVAIAKLPSSLIWT